MFARLVRRPGAALFWPFLVVTLPVAAPAASSAPDSFSFAVAGDMLSFVGTAPAGKMYFDGACQMPSTFLKVRVNGVRAWVDAYRSNTNGVQYQLLKNVELN